MKRPLFYRICYGIVKVFYPKYKVIGEINSEGNIIVSNHAQAHGPLGLLFYFPYPKYLWVIGQMFDKKEVVDYAMEDFWRFKSKYIKWFYRLMSKLILAPIGPYLFRSAETIPVYKDGRLRNTFRQTMEKLDEGSNIIIFPEYREEYNHIVNKFQIHFVDLARTYFKRTGKALEFYPVYTCRSLKTILIGKPIKFNPEEDMEVERNRIVTYLQDEITNLAMSLDDHIVIPYVNCKKKFRKTSRGTK